MEIQDDCCVVAFRILFELSHHEFKVIINSKVSVVAYFFPPVLFHSLGKDWNKDLVIVVQC